MGKYLDTIEAAADGLIHHWTFDDYSTGAFLDQVGDWDGVARNPNAHSISGALVTTPLGKGLDTAFYGTAATDDLMQVNLPVAGRNAAFQLSDFTLRFRFFYKASADPLNTALPELLYIGAHGFFTFPPDNFLAITNFFDDVVISIDFNSSKITTPDVMIDGSWVDLVIVNDSGVTSSYLAGVKDTETLSNPAGLKLYDKDAFIGYGDAALQKKTFLNGIIDELSIWNRPFNQTEITALYDGSGDPFKLIEPAVVFPQLNLNASPSIIQQIRYSAVLTGVPNSLADLEIPISSFNGRARSGRESYLSVVVPNGLFYQPKIDLRPLGDIVVFQHVNGVQTEIMRVNYETLRIDQGSGGTTITLTGHKQVTNSSPKTGTLGDISFYSNSGTSFSLRVPVSTNVLAGDTIIHKGNSILIDTISYAVSVAQQFMELSS